MSYKRVTRVRLWFLLQYPSVGFTSDCCRLPGTLTHIVTGSFQQELMAIYLSV
jgi:hypothetical protein